MRHPRLPLPREDVRAAYARLFVLLLVFAAVPDAGAQTPAPPGAFWTGR